MARALTKPDKTRHLDGVPRDLTVEQLNAVDLLVAGQSDREVAATVGVTRQTVGGWRNYNPWFRAELNRRRNEVWRTSGDRLRALIPKALATLEGGLNEYAADPVKAALAVLKLAGAERLVAPPDDDEPEEALAIIDAAARWRGDVLATLTNPPVSDYARTEVLADWSTRISELAVTDVIDPPRERSGSAPGRR